MKLTFLALPLLAAALPPRDGNDLRDRADIQQPINGDRWPTVNNAASPHLKSVVDALQVMQDEYFDIFSGTWPAAIDWTAAVMGTHVSTTLSSIVSSFEPAIETCSDALWWQNIINKYFAHTSFFYYGENAFGLRNQAYDDMLWVVLGWLESIKFSELYSLRHFKARQHQAIGPTSDWHGLQMNPMAAHRARIFYDLAFEGWDETLCHGGMNWNPYLVPYKNAITNELFTAASIGMYLYFPGDNNTAPFLQQNGPSTTNDGTAKPHNPLHLENAIKGYKWLQQSGMQNRDGLYQDGFHVRGWRRFPNGTVDRGSGECNELSTMLFTYNQGVILSASRGLWMATGARSYLDDGHSLIEDVIRATGWPPGKDEEENKRWHHMGRGGVMEEYCDHMGHCSQDGQTFKGIFFWHLSEFCRPLWKDEEDFVSGLGTHLDQNVYKYHLDRCAAYGKWVHHNAEAAEKSRDRKGKFGMWWTDGKGWDEQSLEEVEERTKLPERAVDDRNPLPKAGRVRVLPKEEGDVNDRGRGRTVETQAGGLAVLRARWNWEVYF
jgi:hypothetical protein